MFPSVVTTEPTLNRSEPTLNRSEPTWHRDFAHNPNTFPVESLKQSRPRTFKFKFRIQSLHPNRDISKSYTGTGTRRGSLSVSGTL